MYIDKLIEFKAGEKAVAADVNENFGQLKLSNNEHEAKLQDVDKKLNLTGGKLLGALQTAQSVEVNCDTPTLSLSSSSNYFKITGDCAIEEIVGFESGFVMLEFLTPRLLRQSDRLQLQSNVDRLCLSGDVGIYSFNNGKVKEVNYFTAKEVRTNSFMSQTILNCPKDIKGKADFIDKIEFTKNIVPIMAAAEDEFCKITSSSNYDANYLPFRAFRGNTNDAFGWLTQNGINTGWLKVEFKTTTPKIVGFSINSRNTTDAGTHSPKDFIIEGSNDDDNWDLLGDYVGEVDWRQNERRYFALTYTNNYKYYRISITAVSGAGAFAGFGMMEFFESANDFMPMVAKIELSIDRPLLLNNGKGMTTSGKINQMALITESFTLENLLNNSLMFVGLEKNADNRFAPFITTAQPVYCDTLQRHSNLNSIPDMVANSICEDFKTGYNCSGSSFYAGAGGTFHYFYAYDYNLASKWMASVVGGNQYLLFKFPNFRKAARFAITASADGAAGCVKNGKIKGYNGEEWVTLATITDQIGWTANEVRCFDSDVICDCNQFKLEIETIENMALNAQLAQIEIFEVAYCYVIPENTFYKYDIDSQGYIKTEVNFIGRIKTEHNFVREVKSYAQESKWTSEPVNLAINSRFAFCHNTGHDYRNIKISGWIKDRINGFVMPWAVDSNIDYTHDGNNYGFYIDDCRFDVRVTPKIMQYKDANGVNRTVTNSCYLILQVERGF